MRGHAPGSSTTWGGLLTAAALLMLPPSPAKAQGLVPGDHGASVVVPSAPRTFGTATEVAHTVHGFDFDPISGDVTVATSAGERVCGGNCGLLAGVRLPAGALVSRIELEACDDSATQQLFFAFFRRVSLAPGNTNLTGFGTTGLGATPGCAFFSRNLTTPETIDNENNVYFLEVFSHADVNFMAVRVYYRLQVAPAPGVATFPVDVPTTHPFFRFIEALASAGITGGCGAGIYCPDQPVTRGQMAVFLAVALGLHFTP